MTALAIDLPNYLDELEMEPEPSILSVLDQFAEKLPEQTGGYVHGRVILAPYLGKTRYTFYLIVPVVNDYADPLFYVWNRDENQEYPLYILYAGDSQDTGKNQDARQRVHNANEFTETLNEIFQDSSTKQRIRHWIEIAKERAP